MKLQYRKLHRRRHQDLYSDSSPSNNFSVVISIARGNTSEFGLSLTEPNCEFVLHKDLLKTSLTEIVQCREEGQLSFSEPFTESQMADGGEDLMLTWGWNTQSLLKTNSHSCLLIFFKNDGCLITDLPASH